MPPLDPTTRQGILYPERLPTFERVAPGEAAGLVEWFWVARWHVPAGATSRQDILPFPALNLVVERDGVSLAGPATRASTRDLVGEGWAVAALLRPAAVQPLTADPGALRDREESLDEPGLLGSVAARMPADTEGAITILGSWLQERVGTPDADGLLANRLADAIGSPSVTSLAQLAAELAVSERTLHRLARRHIGLSPGVMLRRRRLQEAAELVRHEPGVDLASIAADLGYTDQAHLTKEFRRVLGFSPGRYRSG